MTSLFGRDRICAVVAAPNTRDMMRQLAEALVVTSTAELRLDWLGSQSEIFKFLTLLGEFRKAVPRLSRATLIATCRRQAAGGRFAARVERQLGILKLAAESGCKWVDLDVESTDEVHADEIRQRLAPARRIISHHDFRKTPENLGAVLRRLERISGHALKVATRANSLRDAARVTELARGRRNVVAVPMGDVGLPARVLALRAGSALAYAPVSVATAPGQVSLLEMKNLYRADRLNRRTRVYGVIGDPIGHSLSPQMQNAGFQARRVNAVYLPFLVHNLRDFIEAIKPLGIAGFSVTLPHKARILSYLDGCDPLAAAIGAVNTVVVRGGGRLYGYNTDYVGVLRAIERRMALPGSRVLLFGAGGAAKAVAFALAQAGAAVCVCARRATAARSLARAVRGQTVARRRLRREYFDAIVNATPVGMYPDERQSPLKLQELNCRLVFDLIYRPRETRLLQLAARRGIETVSGLEMFVAQGTAQWEIWTGERAPVPAMRRAVEAVLEREEESRSRR